MTVVPLLTGYLFIAQTAMAVNNLLPQVRRWTIYYGWKVNTANANRLQLPAALFSFESPVEKNPSAAAQTEVHIRTPVSDTVFHIFLICVTVLNKSG